MTLSLYFSVLALVASAKAHQALWDKGMYCLGGPNGGNMNSNDIANPMYELTKSQWWFHAVNGCDKAAPPEGDFMELVAGQTYRGEIANNQAFTSFGFNGKYAGPWPDGNQAPVIPSNGDCVSQPLLHAHNKTDAAGTALAISYVDSIGKVTDENLVVFSVRYQTPWERYIYYDVPADLPPCEKCICAFGWQPNHCGQENSYMQGFNCRVTSTSTKKVGVGKPPVWCENDPSACQQGPKQMIFFHQADGNNVEFPPNVFQNDGATRSPNYNMKMGYKDGAQNDIFVDGDNVTPASSAHPTTTPASKPATSSVAQPASISTVARVVTTSSAAAPVVPTTSTSSKVQPSPAPPASSSAANSPPPSSPSSSPSTSSSAPPPPPPSSSSVSSSDASSTPPHTTIHSHGHPHPTTHSSSTTSSTATAVLVVSTSSTASSQTPSSSNKSNHCSNRRRRSSSVKRHLDNKHHGAAAAYKAAGGSFHH